MLSTLILLAGACREAPLPVHSATRDLMGTLVSVTVVDPDQDPRDASSDLERIELRDRAVANSGDYRRYFDPEMRYHHIPDPRTGESAEELISVSILAPTAMQADALATAVFVLGPRDGLALVEELAQVEAFVVTESREVLSNSGW